MASQRLPFVVILLIAACFAVNAQGFGRAMTNMPSTKSLPSRVQDLRWFLQTHPLCRVVLSRRWMSSVATFSVEVEKPLVTFCSYLICSVLHGDLQRCDRQHPGMILAKSRSQRRRQGLKSLLTFTTGWAAESALNVWMKVNFAERKIRKNLPAIITRARREIQKKFDRQQ